MGYKPFPFKLVGFATTVGSILLVMTNWERVLKGLPIDKYIHEHSLDKERRAKLESAH